MPFEMPGGRRGLVAPQNTFLESLIKRARAPQPDGSVLAIMLANAQIVDFPVVYCAEEFSSLMGYPRPEVMGRSARGDFMAGALTDRETQSELEGYEMRGKCLSLHVI